MKNEKIFLAVAPNDAPAASSGITAYAIIYPFSEIA